MSMISIIAQISGGYDSSGVGGGGGTPINLNNANIIADGNSYVVWTNNFPTIIASTPPFSTNGTTVYNFGVSGQTTLQMITDQASQVLSLYESGVANILLVCEGGNDVYINGSATNAYNNLKTYCNAAKAAGFYVILTTCIRRNQSTSFGDNAGAYNAKLVDLNNLLIADNSFYDAIIRPDLDPVFATYSSSGYDVDEVHPSGAVGSPKFAELYIDAINSLSE